MNTGVRRLAFVLGCGGAVAHLALIAVFVPDFEQSLAIYVRIAVITAGCFLIPFGIVHGTACVFKGFQSQFRNPERQSANPQGGSNER